MVLTQPRHHPHCKALIAQSVGALAIDRAARLSVREGMPAKLAWKQVDINLCDSTSNFSRETYAEKPEAAKWNFRGGTLPPLLAMLLPSVTCLPLDAK